LKGKSSLVGTIHVYLFAVMYLQWPVGSLTTSNGAHRNYGSADRNYGCTARKGRTSDLPLYKDIGPGFGHSCQSLGFLFAE